MDEMTSTPTKTRYCEAIVIRETRQDPAEYCEEEAVDGSEFCENHGERDDYEPDDRDYAWPDEHSWGL
jgi:hypothetical protein